MKKKYLKLLGLAVLIVLALVCSNYVYTERNGTNNWIKKIFALAGDLNSSQTPHLRNDIYAVVVSDFTNDFDSIIGYEIVFFTKEGQKISDFIAVDASEVFIDDFGLMTIQVPDDYRTRVGDYYASVVIKEDAESLVNNAETIMYGTPCIQGIDLKVVVCDGSFIELNTATSSASYTSQKYAVKGFTETIEKKNIIAGATEAQASLRNQQRSSNSSSQSKSSNTSSSQGSAGDKGASSSSSKFNKKTHNQSKKKKQTPTKKKKTTSASKKKTSNSKPDQSPDDNILPPELKDQPLPDMNEPEDLKIPEEQPSEPGSSDPQDYYEGTNPPFDQAAYNPWAPGNYPPSTPMSPEEKSSNENSTGATAGTGGAGKGGTGASGGAGTPGNNGGVGGTGGFKGTGGSVGKGGGSGDPNNWDTSGVHSQTKSSPVGRGSSSGGDSGKSQIVGKGLDGLPKNSNGDLEFTTNRPAVNTDGTSPTNFGNKTHRSETSLPGLSATKDNYFTVPIGSNIKLGTRVTAINENTGATVKGIVGDRGPSGSYREMSTKAANALGVHGFKDKTGNYTGNAAKATPIKIIYHTGK